MKTDSSRRVLSIQNYKFRCYIFNFASQSRSSFSFVLLWSLREWFSRVWQSDLKFYMHWQRIFLHLDEFYVLLDVRRVLSSFMKLPNTLLHFISLPAIIYITFNSNYYHGIYLRENVWKSCLDHKFYEYRKP